MMATLDGSASAPHALEEVAAKYAAEAAKRLREDGNAQFQTLQHSEDARVRSLAADPWADHAALDAATPALADGDHVKFLVLGAGVGGVLHAVRLVQNGFSPEDIRLVDPAGGIGGTWYWNRYPGLHCDIEASVYMPLLEEMDYMPSRRFAPGCEIRAYLEKIAHKFGFADKVMFRTHIDNLTWDDAGRVWRAHMRAHSGPDGSQERRLQVQADFVLLASGLFPTPKAPKLDGLSTYGGQMFHTSRWDYAVTGGSCDEPKPVLDKLAGKRVGIIGTGATAVQVVPELAKHAAEVVVFQRTPSQVLDRGQRDTDPEEWRAHVASAPGWQKRRQEANARWMASCGTLRGKEPKVVEDEWSDLDGWCGVIGGGPIPPPAPAEIPLYIGRFLAIDLPGAERVRARVDRIVRDRDTAAKLKPWYPTWCKRPTFSDEYLQAFNQPHVRLVDTDGRGVERVTERGVVAAGVEHPVDVLVLSTGYQNPGAAEPSRQIDLTVTGRGGRTLTQKWEQGPASLHGTCSRDFPNLFWLGVTQAGTTVNFAHVLIEESFHIGHVIAAAHRRAAGGLQAKVLIEPTPEAEDEWTGEIMKGASYGAVVGACPPSLLTAEGDLLKMSPEQAFVKARASPLFGGLVAYSKRLEDWRAQGELKGLQVTALE